MIRDYLARGLDPPTIHITIAATEPELLRGRKKHPTAERPVMSCREMMRQFRRGRYAD
jgi:hypothetical protein